MPGSCHLGLLVCRPHAPAGSPLGARTNLSKQEGVLQCALGPLPQVWLQARPCKCQRAVSMASSIGGKTGSHLHSVGCITQQHSAGAHEGACPDAGSLVAPGALLRDQQAVIACWSSQPACPALLLQRALACLHAHVCSPGSRVRRSMRGNHTMHHAYTAKTKVACKTVRTA